MRAGLLRIEEELSTLERGERPAEPMRERPERYLKVLVDVPQRLLAGRRVEPAHV